MNHTTSGVTINGKTAYYHSGTGSRILTFVLEDADYSDEDVGDDADYNFDFMYQDFLTKEFDGYHPDNCNVTVTSDTIVQFKCRSVVYVKVTTCEKNVCTCAHGSAPTVTEERNADICPVHNEEWCMVCNAGFDSMTRARKWM